MRSSATNPTSAEDREPEARWFEIFGILSLATTLLLVLSLWSYDLRGGENWIGPVGASLAGLLVQVFGVAACWLPVEVGLATLQFFRRRRELPGVARAASTLVVLFLGCALLHLSLGDMPVFGGHLPGGVLGEVMGEVLRSMVGLIGAYVVCVTALLVTLVLRTSVSLVGMSHALVDSVTTTTRSGLGSVGDGFGALWEAWREAREIERAERARAEAESQPRIVDDALSESDEESSEDEGSQDESCLEAEDDVEEEPEDFEQEAIPEPAPAAQPKRARSARPSGRSAAAKRDEGPVIVAPRLDAPKASGEGSPQGPTSTVAGAQPFVLPPASLLSEAGRATIPIDEEELRLNASRLVEKLEAYGVKGRVDEIHPGPVVTMYEFEPQSGTKISKIAGLADDLAMALAAQKVRIVAPIPGKARVGFELPNEDRQTVYLREILEDQRWAKHSCALPVALGKDIAGQPVYADLAKMPHLLVAGATGAGKSVGLNVMLTSLLMKKSPEELRVLMIDPKVVELAVFDGIPHMLLPVVTDMKKASLALRWAVDEMERRYQLFADAGARNVVTYNSRVARVLSGEMTVSSFAPKRAGKVRATGPNGEEVLLSPTDGEAPDAEEWMPQKLPHIVLVVDEFADLMMVAAKDVEAAIARLAQKARAAGIHVILATQRPSVDVITGMIKANFPSRIGFKVSQREDSKTILGRTGAEHLLGLGDMLTILPGSNDLHRVHSAFISEDEVKAVCDFLRAQGLPVYDDNILQPRDDDDDGELGGGNSDDPLYDRAVAVVAQAGYCSISHLQRNLSVGYNKAARLVERMEKEGVVGPASGKAGGRREVFIQAR